MSVPERSEELNGAENAELEEEEEYEEIAVSATEDGQVWIQVNDWEIYLSPEEARELANVLLETADDAEAEPTE